MRGAQVAVRELGAIDNAAYRSINRTNTLNACGGCATWGCWS